MARILCMSMLQPEQRHQVKQPCLRIVTEMLLKLCHSNPIVLEALSHPHTFLCKPCVRKIEKINKLKKALIKRRQLLKAPGRIEYQSDLPQPARKATKTSRPLININYCFFLLSLKFLIAHFVCNSQQDQRHFSVLRPILHQTN